MNDQEINENNRNIIANVAHLLAEKKVNISELIVKKELVEQGGGLLPITLTEDEEQTLFYAKFLYDNAFVDENGKVTEEGINALYH